MPAVSAPAALMIARRDRWCAQSAMIPSSIFCLLLQLRRRLVNSAWARRFAPLPTLRRAVQKDRQAALVGVVRAVALGVVGGGHVELARAELGVGDRHQ